MAITYNITIRGVLDGVSPYITPTLRPNAELFPGSLVVQDGQRDQLGFDGVPMGIIDPNDLFGHVGSNYIAFLNVARDGALPADPRIAVERVRATPAGATKPLNEDGPPIYLYEPVAGSLDRFKLNPGVVPEGYVLRFTAIDNAGPANILGPWHISITVGRLRTAEDYNKVCVLP